MNLASVKIIKELLEKHNIRPSKSLGQHFLIHQETIDKIAEAARLDSNDTVLEIGPGLGVLAIELAKHVKRVVAVERDKKMIRILEEVLEKEKIENVRIIEGDIVKISNAKLQISNQVQNPKPKIQNPDYKLPANSYKLVANLPYQITSEVFKKFLEKSPRPESMTVMIQKEVAERIIAKPGSMSILSVAVQLFGKPSIVAHIPKTLFWPEPQVDSSVLHVDIHKEILIGDEEIIALFKLVRIGFSSKRKKLKNNIAKKMRIKTVDVEKCLKLAQINSNSRAQELSINDWKRLLNTCQINLSNKLVK